MKNKILLFVLLLAAFSCKKESCPEGYQGDNCDEEKRPTKIYVSQIRLLGWPETNGGSAWDNDGSQPDIYMEVEDIYGVKAFSTTFPNREASDFCEWNFTNKLLIDPDVPTTLNIYDVDQLDNQPMGYISVPIWKQGEGFPAVQYFDSGSFQVNYTVTYEF